jgi:hypothetical protein
MVPAAAIVGLAVRWKWVEMGGAVVSDAVVGLNELEAS